MIARFKTWLSNPLHALLLLASLLPLVVLMIFIAQHVVKVPFWDQWGPSVNVARATKQGNLTLQMLFRNHNEHRIVFTKLATALSTLLTQWDMRFEVALSVLLAVGSWLLLIGIVRQQPPHVLPYVLLPFSALVFALKQSENWLWAFETQWFFVIFFFLGVVYIVATRPMNGRWLFWSALLAACATFSFASGLLTWPLVIGGLWLMGNRRWQHYALWLAAAALTLTVFFVGYTPPATERGLQSAGALLHYFIIYMSNPLTLNNPGLPAMTFTFVTGFAVFLAASAYLWWGRGRDTRILAPWWMIAGLSLGAAVVTAFGRAFAGVEQAFAPRYTTMATLFWLSVVALVFLAVRAMLDKPILRGWEKGLGTLFLLAFLFWSARYMLTNVLHHSQLPRLATQEQAECVKHYPQNQDPTCLDGLLPNTERLIEAIGILDRNNLNVFADGS